MVKNKMLAPINVRMYPSFIDTVLVLTFHFPEIFEEFSNYRQRRAGGTHGVSIKT